MEESKVRIKNFGYYWLVLKRMAKKGKNAGNAFWSCSAYPECSGTRNIEIIL